MNKVLTVLIFAAITISTAEAQSRSEEALYGQLITNGVRSASVSALDRVLKTPDQYSAAILYVACGVAFREKRLEDAGFLLYVARFRSRFDNALFPPIGTGGNSPMVAFGALQQQLGSVVNPAIVREPKVYARVLARVKSWQPKAGPTYEPGWEYSKKQSEKQAEQALASNRKEIIDHMSGFCRLLQDSTYAEAVRVVQDYNLKTDGDTNRPSKEAYDAAFQTLSRIEKEKGVDGITAVVKK